MGKKFLITISILMNLIVVGYFFYFNFFNYRVQKAPVTIEYRYPFNHKDIDLLKEVVDNGSLFVIDENDQVLINYHGDEPFIPASTLKLLTSSAALYYLGAGYHFLTDFKLDQKNNLYIKGYGDPSLSTAELRLIIQNLKILGLKKINSIILDGSYFASDIRIPGNDDTYEAYDTKVSPLAVNYNTISYKRKGKKLLSGEKETPMFSFAKKVITKAGLENRKWQLRRVGRIGIKERKDSLLYFGYLFRELCKEKKAAIRITGKVSIGIMPKSIPNFYRHRSEKTLEKILKNLLKFSNNYIANQLLLAIGVHQGHNPANLKLGVSVLSSFVKKELKLNNIILSEGSGLSYANKVTARKMTKVLRYFRPHKLLLKELKWSKNGSKSKDDMISIYSKSGGLRSVKSLVGFMDSPRVGEIRFAIILNQSLNTKPYIIQMLVNALY